MAASDFMTTDPVTEETEEQPAVEPESASEETPEGESVSEGDEPTPESAVEGEVTGLEEAIARLAEEEDLDLNDPAQRGIAERMAKRELRTKQEASQGEEETDVLTPFEQELFKARQTPETEEAAEETTEPKQAPRTATEAREQPGGLPSPWTPGTFRDVGEKWTGWGDAAQAEILEFARISDMIEKGIKNPDLSGLAKIKEAQSHRIVAEALPFILGMTGKLSQAMVEKAIGDVSPNVQEIVQERIVARAQARAVADLGTTKEYANIREMMTPGEGKVTFKDPDTGQTSEFPNTPMNRILAKNPAILRIQVPHKDQETAARLTFIERYRQVMKLQRATVVKPKTAQALIQAGQKVEERKVQDRTRQRLNAGPGASSGGGSKANDFFAGVKATKSGTGIESLLRKK